MSMQKLKRNQLKETVLYLLQNEPATRDDDVSMYLAVVKRIAYSYVWNSLGNQVERYIERLLRKVNYQSVRAIRQNLQLNNPELRGIQWKKRHNIGEEVRAEFSPTFEDKIARHEPRY